MIHLFIYLASSYFFPNGFAVVSFVFFDDNHECHALLFTGPGMANESLIASQIGLEPKSEDI